MHLIPTNWTLFSCLSIEGRVWPVRTGWYSTTELVQPGKGVYTALSGEKGYIDECSFRCEGVCSVRVSSREWECSVAKCEYKCREIKFVFVLDSRYQPIFHVRHLRLRWEEVVTTVPEASDSHS